MQATNLPIFNDQDFVPNTLIVSIRAEAIGSTRGEINVSRTMNNQIAIGLDTFDQIAINYNFTSIERMFTVINHEFRSESGTHIMNIFRITLENNEDMNDALEYLSNDPDVIWVEFEGYARMESGVCNTPLQNEVFCDIYKTKKTLDTYQDFIVCH